MQYVTFGKTGLTISELGFGGIPIIRLSKDEAVQVLRRAYDRGITFYDTANAYRDSEDKIGTAFAGIRDKIVIATKSLRREPDVVARHIENSLRQLRTDYIDLYQLHQVAKEAHWDAVFAPGGLMDVVRKAQQEGKIRFIGVTSHNLAMAIKLVKTGLFSSVQFPFNFIEVDAKDELHRLAREQNMGILVMKPFAGGMINDASIAFKYLRQFPDAIPIPGFDSVQGVDEVTGFYETANVVTQGDLDRMDRFRVELGKRFCRRCEYCQPCPNGVMITPAMGYQIVASRMSPAVAVEFSRIAMESVENCDTCGACMERCPYDLPIPDMLKINYDRYEEHRAGLKRQD